MTAAVVILATALAGALVLIGWLVRRHVLSVEQRVGKALASAAALQDVVDQRDQHADRADANAARIAVLEADARQAAKVHAEIVREWELAMEELNEQAAAELLGASPDRVAGLVQERLAKRREALSRRAETARTDRGADEPAAVSRSGP